MTRISFPPRRFRPLAISIAVMVVLIPLKLALLTQAALLPSASAANNRFFSSAFAAAGHEASPNATQAHASASEGEKLPATAATAQPSQSLATSALQPLPLIEKTTEPPIPEAERNVLIELRARRAAIEAKERGLAAREAVLSAAERRIGERVEQLTALQTRLEELDANRRERDDQNWRGLVKTYEAMKPREAAAILNELDTPVLLQIIDRMKEARASQILAAMLPDRARAATLQLAQMRSRATSPPTIGASQGVAGQRG